MFLAHDLFRPLAVRSKNSRGLYRRAARLAADARAASGPRGDQSRLLVSPERRRRGDSEDHTDSPEHVVTTRDGLTLL